MVFRPIDTNTGGASSFRPLNPPAPQVNMNLAKPNITPPKKSLFSAVGRGAATGFATGGLTGALGGGIGAALSRDNFSAPKSAIGQMINQFNEGAKQFAGGIDALRTAPPVDGQSVRDAYQGGGLGAGALQFGAQALKTGVGGVANLGKAVGGLGAAALSPLAPAFNAATGVGEAIGSRVPDSAAMGFEDTLRKNPSIGQNAEDILNIANLAAPEVGGRIAPRVGPLAAKAKTAVGQGVSAVGAKASEVKSAATPGFVTRMGETSATRKATRPDTLTGTIVQGNKADIPKAKSALSTVDTSKVKTYDDLVGTLEAKLKQERDSLDAELAKDTSTKKLSELKATTKVGDKNITHNYVQDAITQLKEHYKATNDVAGQAKIAQLEAKAKKQGLTIKEVNDLARLHGQDLNAFNANGQAASGLTKQAAENTRTGLKSTARDLYKDPAFKAADARMTDLIRTRDLAQKVSENVNKLKQRVTERGWGESVGRLAFQVIDIVSGGALKGFIQSFIPRSAGLKIMNALDLEKALQKNLQELKTIIEKDLPEAQIKQQLEALVAQDSDAFLNSQPKNSTVSTIPQKVIPPTLPSKVGSVKATKGKK